MNGLPTFDATVAGIDSVTPYFLLDFTNDKTVVWGAGCVQGSGAGLVTNASCSAEPTNLMGAFNSSLATDIISQGNFTNVTFSGFQVSGKVW